MTLGKTIDWIEEKAKELDDAVEHAAGKVEAALNREQPLENEHLEKIFQKLDRIGDEMDETAEVLAERADRVAEKINEYMEAQLHEEGDTGDFSQK